MKLIKKQTLLLMLFSVATFTVIAQTKNKPNIIIMMADDLGYGDVGCFGNEIIQTPNLDQLAKRGVKYTAFYSGHPSCSPSRSAMMTGRTPFRNGIYNYIPDKSAVYLREKEVTVAEICKQAGYDTGFFGKWGLIGDMENRSQPQPNRHGFDTWMATHNNAIPSHKNPTNFYENGVALGEIKGYSSQIVMDKAMKWLDSRKDKSRPFCLVLWFHEPHLVLGQPDSFREKYKQYPGKEGDYYANVNHLDFQIGRFMSYLNKDKADENSLILFTSDNGPKGDGPGKTGGFRGSKGYFYEGGYREPTIMYWKGMIEGGREEKETLTFFDLVPTLYDLFHMEPLNYERLDGISLMPLFKGKNLERPTPPIWMGPHTTTVKDGDWKLVGNFERFQKGQSLTGYFGTRKIASYELYDLKNDPFETKDLAKDLPVIKEKLIKKMNNLVVSVQSEMVPWNGRNVLPFESLKQFRKVPLTRAEWNAMTPEQQEYFGEKPIK
jgi:arylsulfatase A